MDSDVDEELKWNFSCRFTQHPKLPYKLTITLNTNNPVVQCKKKTFYDQVKRQLCVTVQHLRDKTRIWSGTWNEKFIEQMTNRGGCKLSLKGFAYLLCLGCQHLNMESDKTLNFVNFNCLSLNLFFPAELGLETVATNSARETTQVVDKLYLILSWRKNEKSSAWHFPLPLLLSSNVFSDDLISSSHLGTKQYSKEMELQEEALQKLKTKILNLKKHLEREKEKTDSSKYKQSLSLKETKRFIHPTIHHETSTLLSSFLSDSSLSSISLKNVPTRTNVSFVNYGPVTNGVESKPLQNVKSPEITSMRDALRRSRSLSRTLMSFNSRSPCTNDKAMRVNSTRTTCNALQDSQTNVFTKSCRMERKISKNTLHEPCFFSSLNAQKKDFSARKLNPRSSAIQTDKSNFFPSLINHNIRTSQSDVFTVSFNDVKKTSLYRTPSVVVKKTFPASQISKTKQNTLKLTNKNDYLTKFSTRKNQDNELRFSEKVLLKTSNDMMFPEKNIKNSSTRDAFQKSNKSSLTPIVAKKKKNPSLIFNQKATPALEKHRVFSQDLREQTRSVYLNTGRSRQDKNATIKNRKNVAVGKSTIYTKVTDSSLKKNVSCKISEFLSAWNKSSHASHKNHALYCESTDTSEDSYSQISQRIFALQKKLENEKHY